jgi:ATP synthase protein I
LAKKDLNPEGKKKLDASDLISKIDELKEKERLVKTSENIEKRGNSIGLAFRLSTELVSGIVVGSVMGWSLDKWLGSQPWFFLIFFILGIAAGIINVIKTAKNMNNES